MDVVRQHITFIIANPKAYMFRLHKAVIIRPYVLENYNYSAVAVPISMAEISPFHKAYVNVTSGRHFDNM